MIYEMKGTVINPVSKMGENFSAIIIADNKDEAYERAGKLRLMLYIRYKSNRSNLFISKWWYVKPITLVDVL